MKTAIYNTNRRSICTTCLVLVSAFALFVLPINQLVEGFKVTSSHCFQRTNTATNIPTASKPITICYSTECNQTASDMGSKINNKVKPCNDFYQFACGNYLSAVEIPDDKASLTTFSVIEDKVQEQLRDIIEEERPETDPKSLQLPNRYYKACMNEAVIESLGSKPVENVAEYLGGWPVIVGNSWDSKNTWSWLEAVHKSRRLGFSMDIIVDFSIVTDSKNSTKRIIDLDQSSTLLPRDFLIMGFNESFVSIYYDYMVDLAVLFGAKREVATMELKESLQFEMDLANISVPYEKRRNVDDLYNLLTIKQLQESYPYIQWLDYIKGLLPESIKVDENEVINVRVPTFFDDLGKLLQRTKKRVIANYVMWRIYASSVNYLSEKFSQRRFKFVSDFTGQQKRMPRWKECLNSVLTSLGILVGSLYVRKHFKEDSKAIALDMVNGILGTFSRRLDEVDWMDATTKREAKKKLNAMTAYVGYPDELLQDNKLEEVFGKLEVDADKYFESYLNLNAVDVEYSFSKLRLPVNKTEWITQGHTYDVNAFYFASENSMRLTAGILQGHFFNSQRPKYINYATIGNVIGHEIIHGFDDKGRQYDGDGNLVDWWQPQTKEAFLEKARCIIEQYGNFTDEQTGLKLNGIISQGENIADNGGINIAYLAYKQKVAENGEEPWLPGLNYNPNQLFWISAAQTWCSKFRTETMKAAITYENHVPSQYRVVGPFRNMKEFSNDFQCSEDAPMNPTYKCKIY